MARNCYIGQYGGEMNKVYTQEEISFVKENAPDMTDKKLLDEFNRQFGRDVSFSALRKLRQRLGVKKCEGRPRKVDI